MQKSKATGQIGHPKNDHLAILAALKREKEVFGTFGSPKKHPVISATLKRAAVTHGGTTKALIYAAFPFSLCHTGVMIGKLKS